MRDAKSGYHRVDGVLYCEGVSLEALAEKHGTPLYVYSAQELTTNFDRLKTALDGRQASVHFAVKANTTRGILALVHAKGFGADVVSEGELRRALAAGFSADRVVFSGVGKNDTEFRLAAEVGVNALQIESVEEITDAARAIGDRPLRVALRVNPDIDAKTHPKIATGLYDTKFGIAESELNQAIEALERFPQLKLVGLSCHVGSQIADDAVYTEAAARLSTLMKSHAPFRQLEFLNVGGGFNFDYREGAKTDFDRYIKAIYRGLVGSITLAIEPGRSLVVDSGVLLTRVLRTKKNPRRQFAIVDAAMTELIRPALYEAFHPIDPVRFRTGDSTEYEVVGPVCETSDVLGSKRAFTGLESGDYLAVRHVGAYGSTMASTYNSRPRAAEVLVDGDRVQVLTERETLAELTTRER